jgi:hypothetical protein
VSVLDRPIRVTFFTGRAAETKSEARYSRLPADAAERAAGGPASDDAGAGAMTNLPAAEREKLRKLLAALLGSDKSGKLIAAAAVAARVVQRHGLIWQGLSLWEVDFVRKQRQVLQKIADRVLGDGR